MTATNGSETGSLARHKKRGLIRLLLATLLVQAGYSQSFWHKTAFPDSIWIPTLSLGRNNEILAGTDGLFGDGSGRGVLRTSDGGMTWWSANGGVLDSSCVWHLRRLDDTTLLCASSRGVFKTTDNGTKWSLIYGGATTYFRYLAVNRGLDIFVAQSNNGVHRSLDRGSTWKKVFSGIDVKFTIAVDSLSTVFTFTGATVSRSLDNGNTWAEVAYLSDGAVRPVRSSAISREGTLLLGTASSGGVYRSTDQGSSYLRCTSGMGEQSVGTLFVCADGSVLAGTWYWGVYLSTDDGTTWIPLNGDLPPYGIASFELDSNGFLFMGTEGNGIYRSSRSVTSYIPSIQRLGFKAWPGSTVLDSMAISNQSPDTLVISGSSLTNILFDVQPKNAVVLPGEQRQFRVSYSPVATGIDTGRIVFHTNSFLPHRSIPLRGISGLPHLRLPFRVLSFGGVRLDSSSVDSVFCLRNDGVDTLRLDSVFSTSTAFSARLHSRYVPPGGTGQVTVTFHIKQGFFTGELIALSNSRSSPDSILMRAYGTIASLGSSFGDPLPLDFVLEPNFPNPFNPSTTIRYGLPQRSQVTLTVFNMLGQKVAQLVDGVLEAGYHEVKFDARGLSSGVYLYRMQAGGYVESKRLLLIR